MEQQEPRRALVVAAHPDDAEFGAAGTTALRVREGWEYYYLITTNGSKGTDDPELQPSQLVEIRRREQRAAAEVLGVKEVFFLDHEDGELAYDRRLLGEITRIIRLVRPYAVFTHSTEQIIRNAFINHTDHRNTGAAVLDAVYPTARDRWNFPEHLAEGLEPHKVREVYIWGANEPNVTVDITDVVDVKIQALLQHHSQVGQREDFVTFARERWKDENGRYVERFRKIELTR
ncbi:MAG TPA: PIG-L deacetylase family protein [Dehalococcoidia bacterium]